MPVSGKNETIKEEGQDKQAFTVSFTNGAKEQIEELKKHFSASSELEIVKLGISILQNLKERDEKKANEPK